ncbi:acyltransferase family protein [Actinoplanes sp. NPDC051513]|uniref:acyltransferase family protein n=1 Tax=Actinoplanes sp. NPDC051513 TaxID=3363908 RepID=UPI0037A32C2F
MPQRRMAWLDALRAVAALLVVYAHLSHYLLRGAREVSAEWLHAGPAGVMLFFLVSGYIIPASLERHGDLRRFWIGRIARLYPLYLVVCGLMALTLAFAPAVPLTLGGTVAHLTMLPQLLGAPLLTPVVWTLTFEMAFYLIVAALFALRLHRASAAAAVAFAIAAVATAPLTPGRLASPALPFVVAALLAAGVAALTSRRRSAVVAGALLLLALSVMLLVAGQDVSHVWDGLLIPAVMFTGTTIYRAEHGQIPRWQAAATVAVVAAALLANWFAELVSLHALTPKYLTRSVITLLVIGGSFAIGMAYRRAPRSLAWLGRVSYSTYLIHVPLIGLLAIPLTALGERLRGPVELLAVAGFLGLLFALSWLAHRYVELPGQRLGRRLTATHEPRPLGARPEKQEAGDRRDCRDGHEKQPVERAVRVAD